MANERIRRRRAETLADMTGRAILTLGLLSMLAACVAPSATTPNDVAKAGAFVMTAVGDAEEAARRARAYNNANLWKRAARELEETEVILRKANDERKRIREAHRAAVAILAAARARLAVDRLSESAENYESDTPPGQDFDLTAAADRVDRIGVIFAAADRNVATIERTLASLQDLDIPGRR